MSVTADCDDPTTLLLARKGDIGYWSGETWSKHDDDRRIWCSDIACRMLEEGLVATKPGKYSDYREGIAAATQAAGGQEHDYTDDPHALTAVVAQIRGLRVLQSMAGHGSPDWYTTLNGWDIPEHTLLLRSVCFNTVARVYSGLCQPPWYPDDALWGPQEVAGMQPTATAAGSVRR